MPELPEVEAARAAIVEHCAGKKIVGAIIADDTKVVDGVTPSHFKSSLLGKTIVDVHRKGKNLWIQLNSPPFPSFQFGMTGAVYIKGVAVTKYKRSAVNDADEWPSKFSKFFIELNDGLEMSFTDKRRFAKVRLLDDPASVPPISELGPDALLEPLTETEFFNSLSKKKFAVKTLLLDQSFISGIGNWIADEVLYQARIHPLQIASSVSREDSARLLQCIKEVLEKAVEVGADSDQYPSSWIFHSREKKPGKAFVDGKKIDFISVGGRTSAYVPELQKLNGEQPTKPAAKPRKQASKKTEDKDNTNRAKTDKNKCDSDDCDGGEKETSVKSKPKRNRKTAAGKPPSNLDDEQAAVTTRTSGRMTATRKKKIIPTSEDNSNDTDADSGDEDQKKPVKKVKNNPPKKSRRNVN
ncbi:hypothetical protein RND81_11G129600 [Saponaria officinalis]|uniref:Formamidopyrimidine-DNA glycosylase catalytic domain-containing protein n=1 Tax=Saponaria officinalis TaxID=3572 RepID=A0AAW1HLE4_SAPOF